MLRTQILLACFFVMFMGCDTAQRRTVTTNDPAAPALQEYVCYRLAGQISIDGKLDEAAWRSVPRSHVFGDIATGAAPRYAVHAKLAWDNDYLYVAYSIDDPNVWADCVTRDAMMYTHGHNECFVKLFMDPDGDGGNYLEIHVNPLNNVLDCYFDYSISNRCRKIMGLPAELDRRKNYHPEWDCSGMKTMVSVNGTLNDPGDIDVGWVVEMALPWSSLARFAEELNCPPSEGDSWQIHLARRYHGSRDATDVSYWTWPRVGEVNCHRIDTWGRLVFKGGRNASSRLRLRLEADSARQAIIAVE